MMHIPHPSLIKSYIQFIKYSSVPDALQDIYSLVHKEELSPYGTSQTPADWIIK